MWRGGYRLVQGWVALLLAAVYFMLVPVPALAQNTQTSDDADAVAKWFETYGLPIVRSQATDVFDKDISADPEALSLGAPQRAVTMNDQPGATSKPTTAFVPSDRWVAPIMKGDNPVGALIAIGKTGNSPSQTDVVADIRLATEASNSRGGARELIYDDGIKAWFVYRNDKIEPADSVGANYVLGSIPFNNFMEQHQDFTAVENTPDDSQTTVVTPAATATASSSLGIFVSLFGLALLVVVSLTWLRWDQLHRDEEQLASATYKDVVLARVRNRWDPFAQARLLMHPQKDTQPTTTPPPSNENSKEEK